VRAGKRRATFDFVGGYIAEATIDRTKRDVTTVLREALPWQKGRITFRAAVPAAASPTAKPIRVLIAEAREVDKTMPPPKAKTVPPAKAKSVPPPKKEPPGPPPKKKPSLIRTPALGEHPTRKVDVPRARSKTSPPSSRR